MNPKLIRQYSNILNEAGPYKPPGSYTTSPALPAGTAAAIRAGQGAKPTVNVGTGASGFPIAGTPSSQGAKPSAPRPAKPAAPAPNPNQAAVDAANRVQAGQMAVAQPQTTTGAEPAAPAASGPSQADIDAATKANAANAADVAAKTQASQASMASQAQASRDAAARGAPAPAVEPTQGAKPATSTPSVTSSNPYAKYSNNQATKSYDSVGDFAKAVGNKLTGGTAAPAAPTAAPSGQGAKPADTGTPVDASVGAGQNIGAMAPKPAEPSPTLGEEELEEELAEMMRLSGLQLNEKAVSKQQQKFMGMVHAMQKGKKIKGASPELKKAAKGMSKKAAHDYAATKHKGLPQKVSESVMLEAGSALEHIVTRFKHETKNFLNGAELDEDLYNALYDYYVDNGEMPYIVAKAKIGEDPYQWVSRHFEDALAMMGHQRQFQETVMPVVDSQLSELARLAGLSESSVNECGDMGMGQEDRMNISTNMSSDGTKSVSISAQGEEAESLIQMLKLAGMGHMGHDSHSQEPVVVVSGDDDEMMDEEYANSPEEEYETVNAITRQGNDLNREKRQYADKPKLGDNPMAETKEDLSNIPTKRLQDFVKKHSGGGVPTFGAGAQLKRVQAELKRREQGVSEDILDEELSALLDSVLVKADEGLMDQYPETLGPAKGISPEQARADQARTEKAQAWNRRETERQARNVPAPGVYAPGPDEGPVAKAAKPPMTTKPAGAK